MSLPYMPFWIGDYLKDTRHLSLEQHGAYLHLIMEYWAKGSLPDDDVQLARIVGVSPPKWRKMRPIMQAFFHDGWHHETLDKELVYAATRRERARKAAETKHRNRESGLSERNQPAAATAITRRSRLVSLISN